MIKIRKLLVIILLVNLFSLVYAQQDLLLEINHQLNTLEASFYLKTSASSTSGIDYNDLDFKDLPENPEAYPRLYSVVGSSELIVDSWNAELDSDREINLQYKVVGSVSPSGTLTFSWDSEDLQDSDLSGDYTFTLIDYGEDSSRTSEVESVSMNSESSYSVSNSAVNRYFKIETSHIYCGDSIISSSLNEQCEGADLDGKSCTSYPGYTSGTLTCNSNNCRFNFAQCLFPNGTTGSSNDDSSSSGSSSSGGGGGAGCVNECSLGERKCVEGGYQVCGNFDADLCSEWGSVEKCLGVNPTCKDGFCYGCIKDSDCGEGFCIQGKCEIGCGKSCSELGLFCGNHLICGKILNCGSCESGFCRNGACSTVPLSALKVSTKECSPNYLCSPWSECKVSFNAENVLSGAEWFSGKKTRLCFDSKECYSTVKEEEDCLIEIKTYSKNVSICGENYIEVYDITTDKLLSRIKDSRYTSKKGVEIFLLPEDIECDKTFGSYEVSIFDRVMFVLDLRNVWRLVV